MSDGDKPKLYVCQPHGLYGFSWYLHFCTNTTNWLESVAKPKLAIHSIFFHLPFVRELMESHGCIPATDEAIAATLKKGESVALLVGGIEELYLTNRKSLSLVIKKRKGYARLAKACGVPIQPVLTLGENELFPMSDSAVWKRIQTYLYEWFHVALPLPTWTSLLRWFTIVKGPLQTPCTSVFLKTIETDGEKSEESIRKEYLDNLLAFAKTRCLNLEIAG